MTAVTPVTAVLIAVGIMMVAVICLVFWCVLAVGSKAPLTFAEEKQASPALRNLEPRYRMTQPPASKLQHRSVLRYRRKA